MPLYDELPLDGFTQALARVIAKAQSIGEIAQWLNDQPLVASVQVADYLRKTQPPQREILLQLRDDSAGLRSKSVTIYELGAQQFQLHRLRDRLD